MTVKASRQQGCANALSSRFRVTTALFSALYWWGSGSAAYAQSVQVPSGQSAPQVPPQSKPAGTARSSALEEIVVTAEKRSENVQKVPLSILAIPAHELEVAGISTPLGLVKLAPSLQVSSSAYGSDAAFRIRGFGTPGNTAGDSDVAAYIDGVFIARPGAAFSSMLDIRSVEVLSGPQGTLFGRNAAMGAISINTNVPFATSTLDASVEGGSYGTYKLTGVANVPVADNFAVRVAAQGTHTDGIYHNLLDGKRYGERTSYVGRVSAKWDIAQNLSWIVRLDASKSNGDGVVAEGFVPTASASQLAAISGFVARFGGTSPVYSARPTYRFNQFIGSPFLHDRQIGISSDLSWKVSPKLTLRLLDSYHNWRNDQRSGDSIATSLDLVNVRLQTSSKSQSHELQLVSAKDAYLGGKLGFTAGLYYFRESYSLDQTFNLGSQFCGLLYGFSAPSLVAPCRAGPQANAGPVYFNQRSTSYGGYVQVNYSILPNLDLALGGRGTWDRKNATFYQVAANPLGVAPFITPEGPEPLRFRAAKPSYRASLSWNVRDNLMLFGTYSTGYKSGGFNATFSAVNLGSVARTFKAETVTDLEVGLKSRLLNRRLTTNVTFFDTHLNNFQDRSYNGIQFLIRNAGAVRSRGFDLDGRFRPVSRLTFNYGVTYLDSIYTSNTGAPGLEGCTGAAGCPLVQDLSGKPLQYAPKWHGNAGVQWDIAEIRGHKLSFNGSESFTSSFLSANTDNPQSRLPGYATTDLRLAVRSRDGKWEFAVFGTNVFNKHYFISALAQPLASVMRATSTTTGATVYRGFLGDPARFGARLSLHM